MNEQLEKQIRSAMGPLEGWCTPEKAIAMADLILEYKPEICVELGVFGGKSLIPIGLACRHVGIGVATGIDPWSISAALEHQNDPDHVQWWSKDVNLKLIEELCYDAIDVNNLKDHCFIVKTGSDGVANMFLDRSIGFFHLDANHSEEVSCRHVLLWTQKIEKDGILVMDDIDWPSQRKAVDLIMQAGFIRIGGDDKYGIYQNKVSKMSKARMNSKNWKILNGGSVDSQPDYNRPVKA